MLVTLNHLTVPIPVGLQKFLFYFNKGCICVCMENVCVYMCAHKCEYFYRPEDGFRFHRAGVAGNSELPDVGTGNRTLVL